MHEVDREKIQDAAGAVSASASAIEQGFLALGDGLGKALTEIGEVLGAAEAVPNALGADMADASAALMEIAQSLQRLTDALPHEKVALEDLSTRVDQLCQPLDGLVASIRTIAILARSVRVETAYLDGDETDFKAFSQDILTLAEKGRFGIAGFVKAFVDLRSTLKSTRDRHAEFFATRRQDIETGLAELRSVLEAIEERRRLSLDISGQIAHASRRVSNSVGDAIFSLQIGDRTRQRLEHVAAALQEPLEQEPFSDGHARAQAALQAAHLDGGLSQFDRELAGIKRSMGALEVDAGSIVQMSQELASFGTNASGLQDRLREKLEAVEKLVVECETARNSVDEAIAFLSRTLESFNEGMSSLQQISASITNIGVNAAIKSYRLGQRGRGLAVISGDLKLYAERIVDNTGAFVGAFNALLQRAEEIRSADTPKAEGGVSSRGALGDVLATLREKEDSLRQSIKTITARGRHALNVLHDSSARFADVAAIMEPTREAARDLAEIGREADPIALRSLTEAERYTMAEERDVHRRLSAA